MKKTITLAFIFMLLFIFGINISTAKTKEITGISTVVGSYCHNGFVPHNVVMFGGDLVVADKDNHRLSVVDVNTSSVIKTYGSYGTNRNELRFPRELVVYGKELLVCDSYNNRIVFLDGGYKTSNILNLKKSPKSIFVLENVLYVLCEDGMTIDSYNVKSFEVLKSFSLKHHAEQITGINSMIIGSGSGTVSIIDIGSGSYETKKDISDALSLNTLEDKIYALFNDKIEIYDKDFNKSSEFSIKQSGKYLYPVKSGIYVADEERALVYFYKDGKKAATYGKGKKAVKISLVSAKGNIVATASDVSIDIYRKGSLVAFINEPGAVDIKLFDDMLYVLKENSISAYKLNSYESGEISVKLIGSLEANNSYLFTSMDVAGENIYISEASSGKVLKTSTDLNVFSTVISKLTAPSSVAYGDRSLYVAEKGKLSIYDLAGNLKKQVDGSYTSVTYNSNNLFAISDKAKKIDRFNSSLESLSPLAYEGYFLGLTDIEAKEYGLYICDYSRREIMVYTNETLDISENNITVNSAPFTGSVTNGQTLTLKVSGAGMMNHLPRVGDVRYNPVSCGVDADVRFKEDKGRYTANISMHNVGNYTIKVKYQKQVYHAAGWRDSQTADSIITKDIPVTVTEGNKQEQDKITIIQNELLNFFEYFFKK